MAEQGSGEAVKGGAAGKIVVSRTGDKTIRPFQRPKLPERAGVRV